MTHWVHISSLLAWRRPAVGVIRFEREFANWALEHDPQGSRFCAYEAHRGVFVEVSADRLRQCLENPQADSPHAGPHHSDPHHSGPQPPILLKRGDTFISLGLDWDTLDHAVLWALKRTHDLRVVLACYDLIPTRHPAYFEGVHEPGRFDAYLADLAWCADEVVCISDHTRQDLQRFCTETGAPTPRLHTVRLGCDLPTPSTGPSVVPADRPFVLYVSTLERRKNHALLLRVWRALRQRLQPFRLVLVGMRGWGVDEWMAELQADEALQQDVMVLHQLSDADLAALYRQCAFTVYPSWAEGWGLPVVESLAHGRLCLASNTSSLPEAGAGWAEHLPPGDEAAWLARLAELMADPGQLQALNARIAQGFTPPAWCDTARAVHQIACGTPGPAPAPASGLSTTP